MLQTAHETVGRSYPISYYFEGSDRLDSAKIEARVAKEKGIVVVFLESICNDPAVIAANVALKVSSGDPDYKEFSREEAERDFLRRIREYESVYETITEPHLSYLRITNVGSEVTLSRINGYLQSRIAFYLMNLHLKPRSIYLSRVRSVIIGLCDANSHTAR
jgi:6-phosphofructo-2-kinase/fructose-2,6-biphosphatase 2